jgi:hypothetical protein
MKDCLPGDTFDDDGELGYCWMHHFKCHSARSCHTWAKGGPIKTEKESAEWQGKAFGGQGVKEEITDFNKEDPMNSVIAIRGIGTMSISSALKEVSEMASTVANLAKVRHAKGIQDNFDRYMSLLNTYNTSIQEAYTELAAQRRRGGTASKGIDKDISEHCGDPMADDHKPMRMLLMKLYDKEMQCKPGSPEHFEVMQMIDGCRKNIGLELEENVFTDVVNKVAGDFKKRKQLFGKGKA